MSHEPEIQTTEWEPPRKPSRGPLTVVTAVVVIVAIALVGFALLRRVQRNDTEAASAAEQARFLRDYANGEGGKKVERTTFVATFPVMPKDFAKNYGSGKKSSSLASTTASVGGEVFTVLAGKYSAPGEPSSVLTDTVKSFAARDGKVLESRSRKIGSDPAVDYLIKNGQGYFRGRLLISNGTFFQVQVAGKAPDPIGYSRFLDSFSVRRQ